MKTIRLKWKIKANPERVWKLLTQTSSIKKWTGAPAKMSLKPNGDFSLWNHEIFGKNIEIEPLRKLVQHWKLENWKSHSLVTIELMPSTNATLIRLCHEEVPEKDRKSIIEGWELYYFGPLKELAEELE